ncbi:unnamed protein product [Vicia faba]|uniref:Tripeptidyl-peptidase II n=1 Tax=Vicia faba TaxID=3906 RepID=A0AAV0YAV8_VICFA|nr:unnamed protein product [Vicia faba]
MSSSSTFKLFLLSFILCILFQEHTHALTKTYIVYLGGHSHGPNPSLDDLDSATNSHYDLLASILGSHEKAKEAVMYSYNKHINGFAALLEDEEASKIEKNSNVVSVFLSKEYKLHTTRSWDFLGLEKDGGISLDSAWWTARFGEDSIIANLDSGVWPEHVSFSGTGYGPVPSKWRGNGVCEIDHFITSSNATTFCNRKLIGARIFSKNYEARYGNLNPANLTARDFIGHGTHTLSTAAGCQEADILEAFDHAINDGVDVISTSLGGSNPYVEALFTDGISIGSFHAVAKNVVVVCSAGNDGPGPRTVTNVAPWSFTVAASTIDREFVSQISIGGKHYIKGASLSKGLPSGPSQKIYPMIHSIDARFLNATIQDARYCKPKTLDPTKVKGKILVCTRLDETTSIAQGFEAALAGAIAIFVINDEKSGSILLAEPHPLPGASMDANQDDDIDQREWFGKGGTDNNGTRRMLAYMSTSTTYTGLKPAPVMAGFSSRGPSAVQPLILKPDITAPGVNILAAYSLGVSPSNLPSDPRRIPYNLQQGTSMACPHVAGIVGLLKTLHPSWSSAAIKSAIMTTATTLDNTNQPIRDAFDKISTPFEYGSGHIQPNLAMDPGLVYDLNTTDYLNFICTSTHNQNLLKFFNKTSFTCPEYYNIEDLNYPSITVYNRGLNTINITRTVTNVGPPSTYVAQVQHPEEVKVNVQPSPLTFTEIGEKKTFQVILEVTGVPPSGFPVFGNLRWTNGNHIVSSPIVIL